MRFRIDRTYETGWLCTIHPGYVQFITHDDIEDFVDIVDARAAAKEAIRRGTIPWTQLRTELLERKDRRITKLERHDQAHRQE